MEISRDYYLNEIIVRINNKLVKVIAGIRNVKNLIYNELRARGYLVDIGVVSINLKNISGSYSKKQIEVDFVVNSGNNRYYIQSAYHMTGEEKIEQELRPLKNIKDSFKKIIIVRDNIKLKRDDNGFLTMGLKEF